MTFTLADGWGPAKVVTPEEAVVFAILRELLTNQGNRGLAEAALATLPEQFAKHAERFRCEEPECGRLKKPGWLVCAEHLEETEKNILARG